MPATLRISWSRPSGCGSCTFEYGYKLHSDSTYITGATTNGTVQVITGLQNAATYDVRLRTVAPDLDGVTGPIRSRWIQSQVVTCDTPPPELNSPTQTPLPTQIPNTNTPLPNTNTPIPNTNTPLPNTNTPLPYTNTPIPYTNTPIPSGGTLLNAKFATSGVSGVCGGSGTDVNIYFGGVSIQLGEVLYYYENLTGPVQNGYYYVAQYNTIYHVTNGSGNVAETLYCPTPTPNEFTITGIWTSDPLTSNPTELDTSLGISTACEGTSYLNNGNSFTMTGWGNNICNASRVYNVPSVVLSEVTSNGVIYLRQTLNNFDGSGGNKLWYRKYQRALGQSYFESVGGCAECGAPAATSTPIPQITVNIYGRQEVPYNETTNNVQLVYQTYSGTLGSVNATTSGIQKILTELGTFLVSPSVNAGGNINLGVFKRVENDICDYMEITANVFASDTFNSSRFNSSAGSLTTQTGCSQQGDINGVTISVSQSIDVYVTFNSATGCAYNGTPPLPCINTNQ